MPQVGFLTLLHSPLMVLYLWGKQKADSISGHMSDSIVSLMGTPSILLPTSEGLSANLRREILIRHSLNFTIITYSKVSLRVTSSMSKAAKVTFLVAFLGRIFFSPATIFYYFQFPWGNLVPPPRAKCLILTKALLNITNLTKLRNVPEPHNLHECLYHTTV